MPDMGFVQLKTTFTKGDEMRYPIMSAGIARIYSMCAEMKREKAKTQVAKDRLDQASCAMRGVEPAQFKVGGMREFQAYRRVTRRMGF